MKRMITRLRLPSVRTSFQSSVVLNVNWEGCVTVELTGRLQSYVTFFSLYISFLYIYLIKIINIYIGLKI